MLGVKGVVSARTDIDSHTVTVDLRDESVPVDGVVQALAGAGLSPGAPVRQGGAAK